MTVCRGLTYCFFLNSQFNTFLKFKFCCVRLGFTIFIQVFFQTPTNNMEVFNLLEFLAIQFASTYELNSHMITVFIAIQCSLLQYSALIVERIRNKNFLDQFSFSTTSCIILQVYHYKSKCIFSNLDDRANFSSKMVKFQRYTIINNYTKPISGYFKKYLCLVNLKITIQVWSLILTCSTSTNVNKKYYQ